MRTVQIKSYGVHREQIEDLVSEYGLGFDMVKEA